MNRNLVEAWYTAAGVSLVFSNHWDSKSWYGSLESEVNDGDTGSWSLELMHFGLREELCRSSDSMHFVTYIYAFVLNIIKATGFVPKILFAHPRDGGTRVGCYEANRKRDRQDNSRDPPCP